MIFLRHAVVAAPEGLCYGQLDVGLASGAEEQMAGLRSRLPRPRAIRSSDLTRCRVLAERIAAWHGLTVTFDPRLREYAFGAWEGRMWSDIPRDESAPWLADLWGEAPPGGERFVDLHARVETALADCAEGTIVVSHAGVIRAARMILAGASFDDVLAEKVPHCEPIALVREAA